ncbi:MAG TPA: hypothetical protein VF950_21440 [Planctomycetota bacterium]
MKKRLKTRHEYHDGLIRDVEYRGDTEVSLAVDLRDKDNPFQVHLTFTDVRNFAELRSKLEEARAAGTIAIDEILSLSRHEGGGYWLHLARSGSLRVDARGFLET